MTRRFSLMNLIKVEKLKSRPYFTFVAVTGLNSGVLKNVMIGGPVVRLLNEAISLTMFVCGDGELSKTLYTSGISYVGLS